MHLLDGDGAWYLCVVHVKDIVDTKLYDGWETDNVLWITFYEVSLVLSFRLSCIA